MNTSTSRWPGARALRSEQQTATQRPQKNKDGQGKSGEGPRTRVIRGRRLRQGHRAATEHHKAEGQRDAGSTVHQERGTSWWRRDTGSEQARGPGKEQPWTGLLKLMDYGCWSCSQQGPGREVISKTVGRKRREMGKKWQLRNWR